MYIWNFENTGVHLGTLPKDLSFFLKFLKSHHLCSREITNWLSINDCEIDMWPSQELYTGDNVEKHTYVYLDICIHIYIVSLEQGWWGFHEFSSYSSMDAIMFFYEVLSIWNYAWVCFTSRCFSITPYYALQSIAMFISKTLEHQRGVDQLTLQMFHFSPGGHILICKTWKPRKYFDLWGNLVILYYALYSLTFWNMMITVNGKIFHISDRAQ